MSAFPTLLRRLLATAEIFDVEIGHPIRRHRDEFVEETKLKNAIALAKAQPDCVAILVLFDSDGACPKALIDDVRRWATAAANDVPCEVVIANREYEAWFLGAVESLRGVRGISTSATSHTAPESVRDAKGAIEARMTPSRTYAETTDQAAMSASFDMALAHQASRSFRRLVHAFGLVVTAAGLKLPMWPPPGW